MVHIHTHIYYIYCSKQLGEHFVYRVPHQWCKDAWGLQSDQLWSWPFVYRFLYHCPRCNWQSIGRRVKCQTTHKTGVSFVRGDRPSFPLLVVYIVNSAFSFSVWSNYFHGKHQEIMRYMQPCEVAQAVQLLQDGPSVCLVQEGSGYS